MSWPRAIIHVDMDTFFVSVERKNNPDLVGRPVIVGGGKDGELRRSVVAACSYETRKFGVHSAMPLVQAVKLCPDAIVVPVGTSNYPEQTARIRAVLESFTDRVEMTSPDEAYVDLAGVGLLHGPPLAAADKLRNRIRHETELPVSVGLATSKTVAKIASKLSKPSGLFVAMPGSEAALLAPFRLRALPGLGPKTAKTLESWGVKTLGQLVAIGERKLADHFGDHGASLWRRAQGDCRSAVDPDRQRVQISSERTFAEDLGDPIQLDAELARMIMRVGVELRRRRQWAGAVAVKLRYPDFRTLTRREPLAPPTCDDRVLLRQAKEILYRSWDGATPLRLLGVGVSGLVDSTQEDLLDLANERRGERLLETIDRLRDQAGRDAVVWGVALRPDRSD